MIKIGILTFHKAHNYGAVLQAFALQETIKSLKYEVEIIDYLPESVISSHDLFKSKTFKRRSFLGKVHHIIEFLCFYKSRYKRFNAFESFISKYLNLSPNVIKTCNDNVSNYNFIFFGSDQIWNQEITDGIDKVFCGYLKKENCKFISYAASVGHKIDTNVYNKELVSMLDNFDFVSVREKSLKYYFEKYGYSKANVVLDPTLILDQKIWDSHAIKPNFSCNYILIYQIKRDKRIYEVAENLAKQNNWKIIELTCEVFPNRKPFANQTAHPFEFVGYFKYASFILTTSFHGTAFSIIFNKPFYTVMFNFAGDERSEALIETLHLNDRKLFLDNIDNDLDINVDYSVANSKLKNMKSDSINFIIDSINY